MSEVLRGVKSIKIFNVSTVSTDGGYEKESEPANIMDEKLNFTFDNNEFKTLRQALIYSKAKLFGDNNAAEKSLEFKDKNKLEMLGDSIKGLNNSTWDKAKSRIAYSILKEGSENSTHLNDLVNKGVGSNFTYVDKMADKVNKDRQENNLSNMTLDKIVKRFNKNIGLSI